MTTNTDQVRALAELVDAAALMLGEIDTCGHPVDPAYRATLHDAWTKGQAALASAPPSAPVGLSSEDRVVLMRLKDALPDVGLNGWIKGVRVIERILAQQPAAVDEASTWSRQQPTVPGIYGIRGFNLCRPASEQFEAVVVVREHGGELVCNLHESTSEDDLESWVPICDLDPDFEWRAFAPGWEQRGGRALAAQQQGGA